MNKKSILIVIGIIVVLGVSLFFIFKNKGIEKFSLDKEYYEKSELVLIDKEELIKKINDKESFALDVYLPGCTSCAKFKTVLDEYLSENTVTIFQIEYENITDTEVSKYVKYAPSLVLFNKGKITSYLDSESDEDTGPLTKVNEFKKWLEKRININ